jgi:delta-1-pyrroline-5-carboxylate synthetase
MTDCRPLAFFFDTHPVVTPPSSFNLCIPDRYKRSIVTTIMSQGNAAVIVSASEPSSRSILRSARRVCVKAGTSVVANENGSPSLTRLGAIAEQISELNAEGVEVIFVSSGSVGMGKRLLRKQGRMLMTFKDMNNGNHATGEEALPRQPRNMQRDASFASLLDVNARPHTLAEKKKFYDSACAAAGQFEMMNLYSSLFNQCDVSASQILVTQSDFTDPTRLNNLKYSVERLLGLGIVPIFNENDAVSANLGYTADDVFSDNDSLAALCARSFDAEVLLLLTDVEGVYDRPPTEPGAKKLDLYLSKSSEVAIGEKSAQGELRHDIYARNSVSRFLILHFCL